MDKHNPTRRPVTVADVARAAQVSKATAARALGGYGAVRADLKDRILEAARRLDYRPNELARTMATGRSGTIGVIVGRLAGALPVVNDNDGPVAMPERPRTCAAIE